MSRGWLLLVVCVAGCYTGARTTRDINQAWVGHTRAQIEAGWGTPSEVGAVDDTTVLTWTHTRTGVRLPSGSAGLRINADETGVDVDGHLELRRGEVWKRSTHVVADVAANGLVARVEGPSLRWGPPNEANIHWGTLFGFHAGMGRLDDTGTWLPSGGLYIGGMLSRTVGLVGTFTMASGIGDGGGAIGFAWGLAAQWWSAARFAVRAGPAAVLAMDPGFENVGFEPAAAGAASYAVIKRGTFALDVRVDLTAGTSTQFVTAGIGVNLN